MKQDELIKHLEENGCLTVRVDKRGYVVMRSPITGKITGVPVPKSKDGEYLPATICHICKNMGVEIPDCAKTAEEIISYVHANHINNNN